jgi:ferritin-like metal-binding protein YciE
LRRDSDRLRDRRKLEQFSWRNEMKSLDELFVETLRDIYYVEKQLTKALPKMAKKATSESLAQAFTDHLEETEGQIERLDKVFELVGKPARGKKCAAIEGLLEEATEIMSEAESDVVRDAGMLAAAQAVEHYEISRYGTLKAWAEKLQLEDAVELLDETLQEEKATDQKLSELAESEINVEAEEADEDAEEEKERPKAKAKVKVKAKA